MNKFYITFKEKTFDNWIVEVEINSKTQSVYYLINKCDDCEYSRIVLDNDNILDGIEKIKNLLNKIVTVIPKNVLISNQTFNIVRNDGNFYDAKFLVLTKANGRASISYFDATKIMDEYENDIEKRLDIILENDK